MKKYLFFSTDAYCHAKVLLVSRLATNIGKKVLVVDATRIGFLNIYFNITAGPADNVFTRENIDFCIGGFKEEPGAEHYDYVFYLLDSCMDFVKESKVDGAYLFLTQNKIDRKRSYELIQQGRISEMSVIIDNITSSRIKPVMILSEIGKFYNGAIKKTFHNLFILDDYAKYLNNVEEGLINLKSYSKDLKIFISDLYIDLAGTEDKLKMKSSFFK